MHFYRKTGPVFLFFQCLNQPCLLLYRTVIYFENRPEQIFVPQEFQGIGHIQIPDHDIGRLILFRSGSKHIHLLYLFDRQPLSDFRHKDPKFYRFGNEIIHPLLTEHFFRSIYRIGRKRNDRHVIVFLMKTPDNTSRLHTV